jgi:hypothetical protein
MILTASNDSDIPATSHDLLIQALRLFLKLVEGDIERLNGVRDVLKSEPFLLQSCGSSTQDLSAYRESDVV